MSLSKPERMVWDDAAHLRLLLTIIAQNDITPNYKKVAAAFGNGVTTNILAQRMCALRKRAFAITGTNPSPAPTATNPDGSPKKRSGRPPKAKAEGGASSAATTPSKKRNSKIVKKEPAVAEEEDSDDFDVTASLKTEDGHLATPTTPPQTPGKLAAEPCTPSRATPHSKVKHGRVEKKHHPRVSPRKRSNVASYNDDGDLEAFILGDIDGIGRAIEGTAADHAYGVVLGENEDEEEEEEDEDEFLPEGMEI